MGESSLSPFLKLFLTVLLSQNKFSDIMIESIVGSDCFKRASQYHYFRHWARTTYETLYTDHSILPFLPPATKSPLDVPRKKWKELERERFEQENREAKRIIGHLESSGKIEKMARELVKNVEDARTGTASWEAAWFFEQFARLRNRIQLLNSWL